MSQLLTQQELECIGTLSQLADEMGIPILVVGASARELAFNRPYGIAPHRSTKDWDFGIRVASWDVFTKFRDALLNTKQFSLDQFGEHRLIHVTGIKIDLVPFGGLEVDGHIRWPQSGQEMNVIGFDDAYDHCMEIPLREGLRVKVALTPLQVALKLLAFADRKDRTDRDIEDLWHFVRNYLEAGHLERVWEEPFQSILGEDYDLANAAALILGYDVALACRAETVAMLLPIIEALVDPYSKYLRPLTASYDREEEDKNRSQAAERFRWLRKGMELNLKKEG